MSKFEHDAAVAAYRQEISTYSKPWFESCESVLEKKNMRGLTCLDLCCGNSEFSHILREKFGMNVVCADYIPLHLEHARKSGFETLEINLEDSSEKVGKIAEKYKASFDLVVNLAAIEHVFNANNLLGFAHKVLKPDGYFLVNTPNIAFFGYLLSALFGGNRPFGEGHHIRFWNYRFLRTHLFLHGFNEFEDYREFYTLPYDTLLRAFRSRELPAKICTPFFHACKFLQKIPFLKNTCTDELTILCRRENTPPVGFEINDVKTRLVDCSDNEERKLMIQRLQTARKRGWLDEHLFLSKLTDDLAIECVE